MSSPGSFPNKAGICILIGFPTSSAPGTRKTGKGKGTQGRHRPELDPLQCLHT